MKKTIKKVISSFMVVLLVLGAWPVMPVVSAEGGGAAPEPARIYVAVQDSWFSGWQTPHVFFKEDVNDEIRDSAECVPVKSETTQEAPDKIEIDGKWFHLYYADVKKTAVQLRFGSSAEETSVVNIPFQEIEQTGIEGKLYYIYSGNGLGDDFTGVKPAMEVENLEVNSTQTDMHELQIEFKHQSPAGQFVTGENGKSKIEYFFENEQEENEQPIENIENNIWDTSNMPAGHYNIYGVLTDNNGISVKTPPVEVTVKYKLSEPEFTLTPSTATNGKYYVYNEETGVGSSLNIDLTQLQQELLPGEKFQYFYEILEPDAEQWKTFEFTSLYELTANYAQLTKLGEYKARVTAKVLDVDRNEIMGEASSTQTFSVINPMALTAVLEPDANIINSAVLTVTTEDENIQTITYRIGTAENRQYNALTGINLLYSYADPLKDQIEVQLNGYDDLGNRLVTSKEIFNVDTSKIEVNYTSQNNGSGILPQAGPLYINEKVELSAFFQNLNERKITVNGTEETITANPNIFELQQENETYEIVVSGKKNNSTVVNNAYTVITDTQAPAVTVELYDALTGGKIDITQKEFYSDAVKAVVCVEEKNFDEAAAKNAISILQMDVNGELMNDQIDISSQQWVYDDMKKAYTLEIDFQYDGNYVMNVGQFVDLAGNKSTATPEKKFTVDTTKPENPDINYNDSIIEKILNAITFGFFKDSVQVTITVEESVSGIDRIEYWGIENGQSTLQGTITELQAVNANNEYERQATFEIPAQFAGNIEFTVYNKAGGACERETDGKIIVVDNISPVMSISYTGFSVNVNDTTYYKDEIGVSLTITEDNFYLGEEMNQISIIAQRIDDDGQAYKTAYITQESLSYVDLTGVDDYEFIQWQDTGDSCNTAFTCTQDGDYTFYVKYKDNSENELVQSDNQFGTKLLPNGTYEKSGLTLDTTSPVISVSYGDAPADGTTNIFSKARVAKITVREHNFDQTAARDGIFITDMSGSSVFNDQVKISAWEQDKNDKNVYTATIIYQEGNYLFNMEYTDIAGNENDPIVFAENNESSWKFYVDETAPTDLKVEFGSHVLDRIIETVTFGFYEPEFQVTISASDNGSPVSKIEYKFGENEPWQAAVLEDVDAITKKAVINFDQNYTDSFIARVYNEAGHFEDYTDNTTYVFDSIAPQVKIGYSSIGGVKNTLNNIDYYSGILNAKIVVDEKNFYEGKATDNALYVNDFILQVQRISDTGKIHTIFYVPYNVDKSKNTSTAEYRKIEWKSGGSEHTANITLTEDGDYTFNVNYADNSKNVMQLIDSSQNSQVGWNYSKTNITLDNTVPVVNLSFEDNAPASKKYFDGRKAIVSVTEHNFNANTATQAIKIVGTDINGNESPIPLPAYNASSWKNTSGDTYIMEITFAQEGNFTIYVDKFADNAKNISTKEFNSSFTVDTTKPQNLKVEYSPSVVDKILNGITFGFYKPNVTITMYAEEDISGMDRIEYEFIPGNGGKKVEGTISELKKSGQYGNSVSFVIPAQNIGNFKFTAYDKAGNVSSFDDNKTVVIDNIAPGISVEYSKENKNYNGISYYNSQNPLSIAIEIEETNFFEGTNVTDINGKILGVVNDVNVLITRVDDENKQHKVNYMPQALVKTELQRALVWTKNGNKYRAEIALQEEGDYTLLINYTDNSGNAAQAYEKNRITVDNTSPEISVSYSDNNVVNEKYFSIEKRTATIVVKEHNFDKDIAKNGIKITSKPDSPGNVGYSISNWVSQNNVHTLTVTYSASAEFIFDMSYSDNAGNANKKIAYANGSAATNHFYLDTKNPTANIKVGQWGGSIWDKVISAVTFNLWSPENQQVEISANDNLSKVKEILYYVSKEPLSLNQIKTLNNKWITGNSASKTTFTLEKNSINVVYSRVTDYAGNVIYLSSNGVILDDKSPVIDGVVPEIQLNLASDTPNKDQNGNSIYNGDVVVDVRVNDPMVNSICSGLNLERLTYSVICDDVVTQSGKLQTYGEVTNSATQLITSLQSTVNINAQLNNSNNVRLVVSAFDNAGNSVEQSTNVMIDITRPIINVEYDNNTPDTSYQNIFKNTRTATIYITERNFNSNKVELEITNTDGVIPELQGWESYNDASVTNGDSTVHKATISYISDGDYTFDIKYVDEASNEAWPVDYGTSVAPTEFTVDQTAPKITVAYDNNSNKNGFYFAKRRTATISIVEHNFDQSRVEFTGVYTAEGKTKIFPTLNGWSKNGDIHTATVLFNEDGIYNFKMSYTDKAGNPAVAYEEDRFCIDQTAPVIEVSGIKNKSANKDDVVGFKIEVSDTNFMQMQPKLYSSTVNEKGEIKFENIPVPVKGGETSYSIENLDSDGVYLLECTAMDKAENTTTKIKAKGSNDEEVLEQTVLFSVNRKGSTFILGTLKDEISGVISYEKLLKEQSYVQGVENNIIITEINPDMIVTRDISLQKNLEQNEHLSENKDYQIDKSETQDNWKEYQYSVDKGLFVEESNYAISLETKDNAQNASYSVNGNAKLSFTVDKTPPEMRELIGLDSDKIYNADHQDVTLRVDDKLSPLRSAHVYVNNKLVCERSADELLKSDGEIEFSIPSATSQQSVKFVVVDFAGNSTEDTAQTSLKYENIIITTDTITLLLNSTWFYILIAVVLFVLLLFIFIIIKRKKKKDEEENAVVPIR